MSILLLDDLQLVSQILDAIMSFLFIATDDSYKRTMLTPEYDRRALILMAEQLFVWQYFLATLVVMDTPEHYFAQ